MNSFPLSKSGLRPVSALFIDAPNASQSKWKTIRMNWQRLAQTIIDNEDLHGTDIIHAGAYAYVPDAARDIAGWIHRVFRTFGEHLSFVIQPTEVQVVARYEKDIDSLIFNDMWQSLVTYERNLLSHEVVMYKPLQVRFVLISGDGDYLTPLRGIKSAYKDDIDLQVIVYGWKEHINPDLAEFATTVHYLDDIQDLVKQKARQLA